MILYVSDTFFISHVHKEETHEKRKKVINEPPLSKVVQ